LAFLVGFGVVAFSATHGDDALKRWVFELAVGAFLAVQGETRFPEVCDEFSDFAGHGFG